MCSSFGSYTLLEKLTRSCESPLTVRRFTPRAAAPLSPLLDLHTLLCCWRLFHLAGNRAAQRSRACPEWVINIAPAPAPCLENAPSKYMTQPSGASLPGRRDRSSSPLRPDGSVHSATKSTNAAPLMTLVVLNSS